MRDNRDRRDLASLGLVVLVYGLVAAPVLHALGDHAGGWELPASAQGWVEHQRPSEQHPHPHEHGHGHSHRHLPGSVEHLQAVMVAQSVVLAPAAWWLPLGVQEPHSPEWVAVAPLPRPEMPQGP